MYDIVKSYLPKDGSPISFDQIAPMRARRKVHAALMGLVQDGVVKRLPGDKWAFTGSKNSLPELRKNFGRQIESAGLRVTGCESVGVVFTIRAGDSDWNILRIVVQKDDKVAVSDKLRKNIIGEKNFDNMELAIIFILETYGPCKW